MAHLVAALRQASGVVLDTDGVLLDSATLHAAAWKTAFDAFLRDHPPEDPRDARPFDAREDYARYVDGRSRLDGARAFLGARGVPSPDAAAREAAARKDLLFTDRLRTDGVRAFPDARPFLLRLRAAGIPRAAASASRHAGELLERAGLRDLFDAVVDGGEAARLALPGKPDPALFAEAARRLGAGAARTAVVEDALAGVEAGRRGGFGLVIGMDRTAGRTRTTGLLAHGADLVVGGLTELTSREATR